MDTYKITLNDKAIESIKKMQEIASAANSAINHEQIRDSLLKASERISQTVRNSFGQNMDLINQSLQRSMSDFAQTIAQYHYTYDIEIMRQSLLEIAKTLSNMQTEQLKALSQIDFGKLNFDLHSKEFDDLVDLAYEATMEDTEDVTVSKEELKETFIESQKEGNIWERINIQLYDGVEKFKKTHFIFYIIMMLLIQHIFFSWFDEAIGKHVIPKVTSIVRELPEKSSEIICHLEQNIEAIILENQNYYYKVSFIDENGIEREGYVAKRNLKMIDKEDDLDEQPTVSGNDPTQNNN
jgi:hypothetical protein